MVVKTVLITPLLITGNDLCNSTMEGEILNERTKSTKR